MGNYFRMQEAEQFTFYRIPKALFRNKKYAELSLEAKFLYGILLDRMGISVENKWVDEQGRAYIYFKVEQLCKMLDFGRDKIRRMMVELEQADLLERKKQGLHKPDRLYLKKFISDDENCVIQSADFASSGVRENRPPEDGICVTNNTKKNNTEYSNIHPSIRRMEGMEQTVREDICYDVLLVEGYAKDLLDELVALMAEILCSKAKTIRIGGNELQTEMVQQRLQQLNILHIKYVMDSLQKNTSQVKNIKAYLLAALFNAPVTMGHYYQAAVNHDFYGC